VRPRAVLVLLPWLTACEVATPPERPTPYEFAIRLDDGFPLIFRWPAASLPVRVWAEPVLSLGEHAADALRLWEAAGLYAEMHGVIVDDAAEADIVIRLGTPEPRLAGERPCRSWTYIEVGAADTAIRLPFPTTIVARSGSSNQDLHDCLREAVAHEIGHALGLFRESDDPADLMHVWPSPDGLSARDVATLEALYHTRPTVRLPEDR
jgi:predicted Zn-dependent protease